MDFWHLNYLRKDSSRFCNSLGDTNTKLDFCRFYQTFPVFIDSNFFDWFWVFSNFERTKSQLSTQDCNQSTVPTLQSTNLFQTFSSFYRVQYDTHYSQNSTCHWEKRVDSIELWLHYWITRQWHIRGLYIFMSWQWTIDESSVFLLS